MLLAVPAIGCSPLNVIGFMFARDDKMPAPYPLTFDKEGPKKDKDEVVVLLLPQLAPGTSTQFVTADRDLASKLAKALPEQSKENKDKKKLRVISPAQVDKFKLANPRWKQMSAGEIGQKLGADFVLEIYMDKMRMYQPGSLNNIYEGRAEITVSIYEVGEEGGEFKDRYPLSFAFPKTGIRDSSAISPSEFKKLYLENLTAEIVRQHVDSRPSSGIADG
jgi:hypothetical protein